MPGTTPELKTAQAKLTRLAEADLALVWQQVADFDHAREVLTGVLPDLVHTYGVVSAALAAEWYSDARQLARVAGRRFDPVPFWLDDTRTEELAQWAVSTGTNLDNVLVLVNGGVSRRVQNYGRMTVATAAIADPRARGWKRVGTGRCDFCKKTIALGAVYSEAGADFHSHDGCGCQAAPAFY